MGGGERSLPASRGSETIRGWDSNSPPWVAASLVPGPPFSAVLPWVVAQEETPWLLSRLFLVSRLL